MSSGDTAASMFARLQKPAVAFCTAVGNSGNKGGSSPTTTSTGLQQQEVLEQEVLNGGLAMHQSLALGGPVGSGKTEWLMAVAALQLARGGSVCWLSLDASAGSSPSCGSSSSSLLGGGGSLNVPRFCHLVESGLLAVYQVPYSVLLEAFDGGGSGLSAWIEDTVAQRLILSNCHGLEELAATLDEMAQPPPSGSSSGSGGNTGSSGGGVWEEWLATEGKRRGSSSCTPPPGLTPHHHLRSTQNGIMLGGSSAAPPPPVPLLIVDGLGATSGAYTISRHLGSTGGGQQQQSQPQPTAAKADQPSLTATITTANPYPTTSVTPHQYHHPPLTPSVCLIGAKIDAVIYRCHCACVVGVTTWPSSSMLSHGGQQSPAALSLLAPFRTSLPSKSLVAHAVLLHTRDERVTGGGGSGGSGGAEPTAGVTQMIPRQMQVQSVVGAAPPTTYNNSSDRALGMPPPLPPRPPRMLNFIIGGNGPLVVG